MRRRPIDENAAFELRQARFALDERGQERYQTDPAWKRAVDAEYAKVFGTQPAVEEIVMESEVRR